MPVADADPLSRLRQRGEQVERTLDAFLTRQTDAPARLIESIRYSLLAGGKRLRPALVLEWHALLSRADQPNASALAAAGAIELIHAFSLVHDDLPAMDDDDLRRGRPTNHVVFGEALAILAGDAMTTLAFELIATQAAPPHVGPLVTELSHASGPVGMIGGQVIDIVNENAALALDQLQKLHAMKTGALLRASCRMGAIAADASPEALATAEAFGRHLGLAFQIMDDVLDETSTAEQMGKAVGKDAEAGKNTYPRLLGLDESRRLAERECAAAIDALRRISGETRTLESLTRFIVERRS